MAPAFQARVVGVQVRGEAQLTFGGGGGVVTRQAVEGMEYTLGSLKVPAPPPPPPPPPTHTHTHTRARAQPPHLQSLPSRIKPSLNPLWLPLRCGCQHTTWRPVMVGIFAISRIPRALHSQRLPPIRGRPGPHSFRAPPLQAGAAVTGSS